MYLEEMRQSVLSHLRGTTALWSDDDITRSINAAVGDLSRILPQEKVTEVTINQEVTGETFVVTLGTVVSLANNPIQPQSETVTNNAGTITYARDTDYTMDYRSGTITGLSAGSMVNLSTNKVKYTKSRISVNISALTDLVRISRVEWPNIDVPQTTVAFRRFGNHLYITTAGSAQGTGSSQRQMSDGQHLVVEYYADHTPPTIVARGSFNQFYDEVIIRGASGYALLMLANQYDHNAAADLVLATAQLSAAATCHTNITTALLAIRTALTATTGKVDIAFDAARTDLALTTGKVDVALAKVTKYMESEVGKNAVASLTLITTNAADLRTAIKAALDAVDTVITSKINFATTGDLDKATAYLETNTNGNSKGHLEQIKTDIADLRTAIETALDLIATTLSATGVVNHTSTGDLAKATSYLESNANGNSKGLLEQIKTDAVNLRTAINAALVLVPPIPILLDAPSTGDITKAEAIWDEEVKHILTAIGTPNAEDMLQKGVVDGTGIDPLEPKGFITDVGGTDISMKRYLGEGDAFINTVNLGANVAENFAAYSQRTRELVDGLNSVRDVYNRYAQTTLQMAGLWADKRKDLLSQAQIHLGKVTAYLNEVGTRVGYIKSYLDESASWNNLATMELNVTTSRLAMVQGLLGEVTARFTNLRSHIEESTAWNNLSTMELNITTTRLAVIQSWVTEVNARFANLQSYINEAAAWTSVSNTFISEAQVRLQAVNASIAEGNGRVNAVSVAVEEVRYRVAEVDSYVSAASEYEKISNTGMVLAKDYRTEGEARRLEFWAILKDRAQTREQTVQASSRQNP